MCSKETEVIVAKHGRRSLLNLYQKLRSTDNQTKQRVMLEKKPTTEFYGPRVPTLLEQSFIFGVGHGKLIKPLFPTTRFSDSVHRSRFSICLNATSTQEGGRVVRYRGIDVEVQRSNIVESEVHTTPGQEKERVVENCSTDNGTQRSNNGHIVFAESTGTHIGYARLIESDDSNSDEAQHPNNGDIVFDTCDSNGTRIGYARLIESSSDDSSDDDK